jgi:ferrochelatase
MAYGGPDSLDDVEPYLLDVRGGRPTSPELVAEIRGRYAAIGGKSPLLEITIRQARALEEVLNRVGNETYRVFVGMRHWKPYIREAVNRISQEGFTHVTALCMTPFSSRMSTGAYYDHLQKAIETHAPDSAWRTGLQLRMVGAWYDHPGFVQALAGNLAASLEAVRPIHPQAPLVIFTAHSLPAALAEQGDPYASQFATLCELVAREAKLEPGGWRVSYQSAGAQNTRWLGPSLEETFHKLAGQGVENILVAPVGFLCDHVEVLYDIDIEAREEAAGLGIRLARTDSLNDQPSFIRALSEIILSEGRTI